MKSDMDSPETRDHMRDRLMQLASGHELMMAVDPDTPGYVYLRDKFCGDVDFFIDIWEALVSDRQHVAKPKPAKKGRKRGKRRTAIQKGAS